MDPTIESDWLGCKKDPIEIPENNVGNVARSWQWRERGVDPPNCTSNRTVLENVAEDILVQKPLKIRCCDLPGSPRSTFLMVFSPDGTKVASTHGNHNVYVSELASGKHVRVLQGHPRTPWCIAFHPSHTQLIGSGCLGGQVRVWDISSGGSEVWYVPNQTVISSIAFHPRVQLLVVATYNELYFWDWSKSAPFTKVSTNNLNEKVRYVAFDALGNKLITGISSWNTTASTIPPLFEQTAPARSPQIFTFRQPRRDEPDDNQNANGQEYPMPGSTQDVIVNSYHSLVQRYDSLVRSYQRLFMFRHRMSVTPPPPATTDRGTDPMETDPSPESTSITRPPRGETSHGPLETVPPPVNSSTTPIIRREITNRSMETNPAAETNTAMRISHGATTHQCLGRAPQPGASTITRTAHEISSQSLRTVPAPVNLSTARGETSSQSSNTLNNTGMFRRQDDNDNDTDGSNSRLLNLDVLSINNNSHTNHNASQHFATFGSRLSAFQPLNESTERTFRTVDQNERTRLPNPFSSTAGSHLFGSSSAQLNSETSSNTSRTSIFPGIISESLIDLSSQRRRLRTLDQNERTARNPPDWFSTRPGSTIDERHNLAEQQNSESSSNRPRATPNSSGALIDISPRRRRILPLRLQMSFTNTRISIGNNETSSANTTENQSGNSSTGSTSRSAESEPSEYSAFDLLTAPEDSQSINESLDLIRDILRDSGSRLVDLITRVSLSTLVGVGREENLPNNSDESDLEERREALRRELSSSSSDSDSDQSLEVNILRTPNSTFREEDVRNEERSGQAELSNTTNTPHRPEQPEILSTTNSEHRTDHPTDRIIIDINNESSSENTNRIPEGFNVSSNSPSFRVRFNSDLAETNRESSTADNSNIAISSSIDNGNNLASSSGTRTHIADGSVNDSRNNASTSPRDRHNVDSSRDRDRNNAGNSSSDSRRTSETQPSYNSDFNPNRPSTSRDNVWTRGRGTLSEDVYRKVKAGVVALHKHTVQLTDIWLQGNTITVRKLRIMWENLRRRIIMIHRENSRPETLSYYTRSLLERCRTLNEMTEVASRTAGRNPRTEERARTTESEDSTSNERRSNDSEDRRSHTRSPLRRSPSVGSPLRRRLQPTIGSLNRWRREDEIRRRSRIIASSRLSNRSRRDYERAIELAATRHEVRMRAMQVLSVMFNSMMMCLEERGLGQVIKTMLRLLKKALALSCLMIMTIRDSAVPVDRDVPNPNLRVDSLNVVRIQTVDHTGPVNVDGPEDSPSNSTNNDVNVNRSSQNNNDTTATDQKPSSNNDQPSTSASGNTNNEPSLVPTSASQRWSNRLAVQIAAANRNTSLTARNRRELYMESRRLKALHRTNPTAHPLIKKRILPPVTTHRIPALRLPSISHLNKYAISRSQQSTDAEPSAPSTSEPASDEHPRLSPFRVPPDVVDEFEQRISLIRRAHIQAVRLRNAARNRFRRLQTIRLYTPSSVRDMFTFQHLNNQEDNQENAPSNEPDQSNARRGSLGTLDFRTGVLTRDRSFPRLPDEAHFHTVFNNVAMPLMQVNDLPTNEVEGPQPQRPPRIHEYLQPIILAQNAMVMDEEGNGEGEVDRGNHGGGGGGGAGQRRINSIANLLDAGIISEAFPAPSHRIQAWDFTTGDTPDISNSTKNIVVAKCKIHNDASIDISKDGRILVALHPVPRMRTNNHWLGVYSLEWSRLGQCLHTAALEQSAVSVALSPTARHLAVGLGSRRFSSVPHAPHARNVFALIYRLDSTESSRRTGLTPVQELEQNWEQHGFRSLNCLRWAPQPGQGFVYANNTGQLLVMS